MSSLLMQQRSTSVANCRRVVKNGSLLIVDAEAGEIRGPWPETLIDDVVRFFARGQQVIIVISAAENSGPSTWFVPLAKDKARLEAFAECLPQT